MIRATAISIACLMSMVLPSAATIINIPVDYPTIQQGIDASADYDTVLVQPGFYVENINFSGHNIVLGSLYLATGDESYTEQTIIDGDSSGSVVTFENSESGSTVLTGFTIQNGYASRGGGIYCNGSDPVISHNIISGNIAYDLQNGEGGGVFCYFSNLTLTDNLITGNYASGPLGGNGGGIYCGYYSPTISRNTITQNLGGWAGGGIYCHTSNPILSNNVIAINTGIVWGGGFYLDESNPAIINNSIWGNVARWNEGGGIYCVNNSNPVITNTILWADSALLGGDEIYVEDGNPILSYCNIAGGWSGIGIIDSFPYFRDPFGGDFHLMSTACGDQYNSPCIDVGDPFIQDSLLDCDAGLGTQISDLGAYGGGDSLNTDIYENSGPLPEGFALLQNYPNPFNAQTSISYAIPSESRVTIEIFDLMGRKIETLVNGNKAAGEHTVTWDAENMPTGIYFYRLRAGEYSRTANMVLLK